MHLLANYFSEWSWSIGLLFYDKIMKIINKRGLAQHKKDAQFCTMFQHVSCVQFLSNYLHKIVKIKKKCEKKKRLDIIRMHLRFVCEFQSIMWFSFDERQIRWMFLSSFQHTFHVVAKKMCIDSISTFELYANIDATEVNKRNRIMSRKWLIVIFESLAEKIIVNRIARKWEFISQLQHKTIQIESMTFPIFLFK